MLIHADVKGLEVVTAAYLSQDPVLCQEIRDGVDIHAVNQERFKLPNRVIAKIFKFRLIYGGSAYSYAKDPEFAEVSTSQNYWQKIIDEYYEKYKGMAKWHGDLMRQVTLSGQLNMPTGRTYTFLPKAGRSGGLVWPRTKILNYPVQGTGADLVSIGRVTAAKRLRKADVPVLWVSTVHDSLDLDIDNDQNLCYTVCRILKESIEDIPLNFRRLFGVEFNLPLTCEIGYGPNLKDLEPYGNV